MFESVRPGNTSHLKMAHIDVTKNRNYNKLQNYKTI